MYFNYLFLFYFLMLILTIKMHNFFTKFLIMKVLFKIIFIIKLKLYVNFYIK